MLNGALQCLGEIALKGYSSHFGFHVPCPTIDV